MKSVVIAAIAVMVLAGTALAAIPNTMEYVLATQPMISGKVASVNDQTLVVDTDQGKQVTLAMDTHTMVPTDLAPGMVAWVEFRMEKDGQYYARRVIPVRGGANPGRELAYSKLHEEGEPVAQTESSGSTTEPTGATSGESGTEHVGAAGAAGAAEAHDASKEEGSHETLPQTASGQPLILAFGVFAIALAGALAFVRRLRSA